MKILTVYLPSFVFLTTTLVVIESYSKIKTHDNTPSPTQLNARYEQALIDYKDWLHQLSNGDSYSTGQLKKALVDIKDQLTNETNITYELVQIKIDIKLNEIGQALLENRQTPQWNDKGISIFKNDTENQLIKWHQRYILSPANTKNAILNAKPNDQKDILTILNISSQTLDSQCYDQHIQPFFSQILKRLNDAEESVYMNAVPEKENIAMLENFISNYQYKINVDKYENHLMKGAFESLYKLFTADGELATIDAFNLYVQSKQLTYWNRLFDNLKTSKLYGDDALIARKADQIVNADVKNSKTLKDFITEAAPRESAFVALQKLCSDKIEAKDYSGAIELASQFGDLFTGKHLYSQVEKKFNNLISMLEEANANQGKYEYVGLSSCNTPKDEIRYVLSREKRFLAIVPEGTGSILTFQRNSNSPKDWQNTNYLNTLLSGHECIFEYEPRSQENELKQVSRDIFYNQPNVKPKFSGKKNIDYYVDIGRGIAFFVSNSSYDRLRLNEPEGEYMSPWLISDEVLLQNISKSKGFHGRVNGNGNFDIYYVTTEDRGRTWSEPKSLGIGVNTPFAERSPFLSKDGNYLYFSSEGHGGFGGFDVFKVELSIQGRNVIVTKNSLRPILGACSVHDDLYYQVIVEEKEATTPNPMEAYFSSNTSGNFDIYFLTLTTSSENGVTQSVDYQPRHGEIRYFPAWPPANQLKLELECDTFRNVALITKEGDVRVRGRVFDSKGRLVKEAYISFFNIEQIGPNIKVSISEGSRYETALRANTKYKITITATTVDNEKVTEYLDDYIDLCPNFTGESFAQKDFQTTDVKDHGLYGKPAGFDFFFNTNQYVSTISNKDILHHHYKLHLRRLSTNLDFKLILDGFADERGEESHNKMLAQQRVNTAYEFFKSVGFTDQQLIKKPIGETNRFDNDDVKSLEVILGADNLRLPDQELKWLLNRRVYIRFSN